MQLLLDTERLNFVYLVFFSVPIGYPMGISGVARTSTSLYVQWEHRGTKYVNGIVSLSSISIFTIYDISSRSIGWKQYYLPMRNTNITQND